MVRGAGDFLRYIEFPSPYLRDSSKVSCKCPCGTLVSIILKQLKAQVRKTGRFQCRSCSAKIMWHSSEYRKKVSVSMKAVWSNPNLRQHISDKSREKWLDPEYIAIQAKIHSDPEYIKSTRLRSQAMWESDDFRRRQMEIRCHPDWMEKQSASMRALWQDSEYRSRVGMALSEKFSLGFRSSLEETTSRLLQDMNIFYFEQKPVGPYVFDFFIPDQNLFIECQGEYWHSLRPGKDASKFTYLSEALPKSKILYLHERDFLNPNLIKSHIQTALGIPIKFDVLSGFELDNVLIHEINVKLRVRGTRSPAQEFLDSYHYSQFGRSSKVVYGAFLEDNLIGVCKFSTPIRAEVATSMGYLPSQILELDRFCIHPARHKKNFASWFMSRCTTFAFNKFPKVDCLVSFSDATHGHKGTIYAASNWTKYGMVPPDYHYVNGDGWVIHKKTLYNHASRNSMKELDYAVANGYNKVYGKEKTKFVLKRRAHGR